MCSSYLRATKCDTLFTTLNSAEGHNPKIPVYVDLTGQFEALNGGLYALGILLLHPKSGRQAEVLQAFMCGSRALEVFSEFSEYATSPQLNIFTTVPTVHDSVADKLASVGYTLTFFGMYL